MTDEPTLFGRPIVENPDLHCEEPFELGDFAAYAGGAAVMSNDGVYRYGLYRPVTGGTMWSGEQTVRTVLFVGLNPSTADGRENDPTVRRMLTFAARHGFRHMLLGNLYALRSTDPKALTTAPDPVGVMNLAWLSVLVGRADAVVACWGSSLPRDSPGPAIFWKRFGPRVLCFGVTDSGQPKHPLRLRADTNLRPWHGPRSRPE